MTTTPEAVAAVLRIPTAQVHAGPNARGDVGDVTELAASLKTLGQQIPVIVRQIAEDRWQLVDGHRRHAAAVKARMPYLDAIVLAVEAAGPRLLLRQLAMQAGARRFNPIAEAMALHTLMFEHRMTREQIAAQVGRSPGWVRDRVALVHLEPGERADVERGRMSVAEATLRLKNRREMREGRQVGDNWASATTAGRQRRKAARESPEYAAAVKAVRLAAVDAYRAGVKRSTLHVALADAQKAARQADA